MKVKNKFRIELLDFCVDKMNEGKAGHVVQIFVYP